MLRKPQIVGIMFVIAVFALIATGIKSPVTGADFEKLTKEKATDLWETSGHADSESEAFRHWDEDDPPEVSGRCSRCHTTPGYVEWAGGDETTAHFPITSVDCWSCHSNFNLYDNAQTRYSDLATNPNLEPVDFPSGFTASYGDVADAKPASNICMGCHQGRSSGIDVDDAVEPRHLQSCAGLGAVAIGCRASGALSTNRYWYSCGRFQHLAQNIQIGWLAGGWTRRL